MSTLHLHLLGQPRVEVNGTDIHVNRAKVLALLAYLAVTGQSHRRDRLADLLWPTHASARSNLRRALSTLSSTIGHEFIDADREHIGLLQPASAVAGALWDDVKEFRRLIADVRRHAHEEGVLCKACETSLRRAAGYYRGDFLAGFSLTDAPGFDDWQVIQTESLRREMIWLVVQLTHSYAAHNELEAARQFGRRWIELDNLDEAAYRTTMRLLASAGERSAALMLFDRCRRALADELGTEPSPATTELCNQIRAGVVTGLPPSEHAATSSRAALLQPMGALVGRATEVTHILQLLTQNEDCRLLTLTGPSGIGKSRLAIEAMIKAQELFADGAYMVELEMVSTKEQLAQAIAQVLGVPHTGQTTLLDRLSDRLRGKQVLLLLDGFEHLADPPSIHLLQQLLLRSPTLKLLITSQIRLPMQYQWTIEIGGLGLPDATDSPLRLDDVKTADSVELFVLSAQRVTADFNLLPGNWRDVVDICRRLDGNPLGILLATNLLRTLSINEIAQELARDLFFDMSPLYDLPGRHQSLAAACQGTWELLTPAEQDFFSRLSVFQGGFDRQAAENIANGSMLLLSALVDKSLIQRMRSGRYRIHSVLQRFAAAQLDRRPGDSTAVRRRHCAYFADLVHVHADNLKGRPYMFAQQSLEADFDNIRRAWRWAVQAHQPDQLGKMAEGLTLFTESRGWYGTSNDIFAYALAELEQELQEPTSTGPSRHEDTMDRQVLLAQLLTGLGRSDFRLGNMANARIRLERAIRILERLADTHPALLGQSLFWLAHYHIFNGTHDAAVRHLTRAVALFRRINDQYGIGTALTMLLVSLHYLGRYDEVESGLAEALHLLRELGELRWLHWAAVFGANTALAKGKYAEASDAYADSLAFFQQSDDALGCSYCLRQLAYVDIAQGAYARARDRMQQSLAQMESVSSRTTECFPIEALGQIARLTGDYADATRHLHRALTLAEEISEGRGIALIYSSLGWLAYDQGRYADAAAFLTESAQRYRELGMPYGVAAALCGLGYAAASARDEPSASTGPFTEAFDIALDLNAAPLLLKILAGVIMLAPVRAMTSRENEQIVQTIGYILTHPATDAETRRRMQTLIGRNSGASLAGPSRVGGAKTDVATIEQHWNTLIQIADGGTRP